MSYDYDWCGHTAEESDGKPCGAPIERWSREWKHRRYELDTEHKAEPAKPIDPVDEGLYLRADRYAEALATAAAASERITVLTEMVRQHEWYRSQAESQLRMVEEDERFGQVWDQTGPEPEDVHALLCLTTGSVYLRNKWNQDWQLAHHDPQRAVHHSWPIGDAGPFIAWREGFDFDQVLKEARRIEGEFNAMHRTLYGEKGYHDERGVFGRPVLAEAVQRILRAHTGRAYEANQKAQAAEQKLTQLRRLLVQLDADEVLQRPTGKGDAEGAPVMVDVAVVALAKVYAILDLPSTGGGAS